MAEPKDISDLLAKNSELRELYYELLKIPEIEVLEDGEGDAIFKAYLKGRIGPRRYFLTLWTHETYVNWSGQESPELCHEILGSLVKNIDSKEGSKIKPSIHRNTILERVKKYVAATKGV